MQVPSTKYQVSKSEDRNLLERFSVFGENIIIFCRSLDVDYVSRPIVSQLIRSSTSIGANYAEAQNGSSRKDFRNKIFIAKKEAQETSHWLRMLRNCIDDRSVLVDLDKESQEIILMLQSIANKLEKDK